MSSSACSLDLDKIVSLNGGSIFASFSERWERSLSAEYIGNVFSTQQIFGFQTYRVIDVSYQQKLFEDRIELRLGRFATTDDFLVSAYSCGFMSNAFCGNPFGILLDAPGIKAYTGTWAALVKVKPSPRSYVMTGVYNGDPTIRENKYHGVNFSLNGPPFAIGEVGYQINGLPGDSQLLGNYKLGALVRRCPAHEFPIWRQDSRKLGLLWAVRPGARPTWQFRQQPRTRRLRLGHRRTGSRYPAAALCS